MQIFQIFYTKKMEFNRTCWCDMMFGYSKGDMIQRLQGLLKISKEDTLVCGDGANDLSMFEKADTRVAFCAKDILKKEANIIVE